MGTKAYFMIKMAKRFADDSHYLDAVRELEAMPEVEAVTSVSGVCDFLVKVDAPIRTILVANKIRSKKWIESLRIMEVDAETEAAKAPEVTVAELLKK
jgi:DNA-binding Lrp family transcriptional regulator